MERAKTTPITVIAISRAEIDRRAVRALLAYELKTEEERTTGGDLSIPHDLIDSLFLERVLAADRDKTRGDATLARLRRIKERSKRKVILKRGTLCDLLQLGIGPGEVLTYCLNHGARRGREEDFTKWQGRAGKLPQMAETLEAAAQTLSILHDSPLALPVSRGKPANSRTWPFLLDADGHRVPLETPLEIKGRRLGVTRPLQAEFWVSPIPPLPARKLPELASYLQVISKALRKYAPYLKRAANRPHGDKERSFIRDWATFVSRVRMRNGPLPLLAHPHMLRHACGFALADSGADTRLIQDFLGHRNIQHTVKYTATNPARFERLWR
jgi:hypothetical protein